VNPERKIIMKSIHRYVILCIRSKYQNKNLGVQPKN
jgi:hypothetical protein